MIYEHDLVTLGFDKKVADLSESSVDGWNRHWYEDRKGNYILVASEFWDHDEAFVSSKGTRLRIRHKSGDEWLR